MLPNYLKPQHEPSRNDEPRTNGNTGPGPENKPEPEIEKMETGSRISRSESDGYNDDYDPMESWADDKPVNWNEKIIFSDEDKPASPKPEENDRNKPRGKPNRKSH